jgi:hypothetical protein
VFDARYGERGRAEESDVRMLQAYRRHFAIACAVPFLIVQAIAQAPVGVASRSGVALDDSWVAGLAYGLKYGQISGRDFVFTYGLLAQVIALAGASLSHGATAIDGIGLSYLAANFVNIALLVLILALTRIVATWHALLILVTFTLMSIPFEFASFRELSVVLCALFLSSCLTATGSLRPYELAVFTGLALFVSQLLTLELAVFTAVGCALVLGGYAAVSVCSRWFSVRTRLSANQYLSMLALIVGTLAVCNLSIDLIFLSTSPLYAHFFDYQRYSLDLLTGYNATLGLHWGLSPFGSIVLCSILLYVVLWAIFLVRRVNASERATLVCLTTFAILTLKGSVVRSDVAHVRANAVPLLFVFLVLLRYQLGATRNGAIRTSVWSVLFVAALALWGTLDFSLVSDPGGWIAKFGDAPSKVSAMRAFREAPGSYLPAGLATLKSSAAPLLSFPYDNYIVIGLGRKPVEPVLQSYAGGIESLQHYYVSQLEREPRLQVIYGLDKSALWEPDGVQDETRLPIIFQYLYQHFELATEKRYGKGYYLLRRRTTTRPMHTTPLPFVGRDWRFGSTSVRLASPTTCGLTRMRVRMSYPVTRLLGRPDGLRLQFKLGRLPVASSKMVPVVEGSTFTTYVSVMKPNQFYQVFNNGPIPRAYWDTLRVEINYTGLFEIVPTRVSIADLACVGS